MKRNRAAGRAAALRAGALYGGAVFAAGFALGAARTLIVRATGVDPLLAVLVELPVMLVLSWIVCGAVLRRAGPPRTARALALTGAVALTVLLAAEAALGTALSGGDAGSALAAFAEPPALAGLSGQVLFALFPLFRGRFSGTK